MSTRRVVLLALLTLGASGGAALVASGDGPCPSVVLLTVDTLRVDRMSVYGYERTTSPHLDRLLRTGALFTEARTVEPLTGPALCAMLTSLHPHESGATRNGLRMRPGMPSLPKLLREQGYRTAAVVSNWTLRDKMTGLAEHFDEYDELLLQKRWFGLVSSEAGADDVTAAAEDWLELHAAEARHRPFFLWVHYIDPHAPYERQRAHLEQLGLGAKRRHLSKSDRYDSEIAHTDRSIGELLERLGELGLTENTLIAFTSDHGESLGEHDYWGHGRHLYETTLRIPMALVWPGRIEAQVVDAAALNLDLSSTIAGLLGLAPPAGFRGFDWTGVLAGKPAPASRVTQHQAHRGAVLSRPDSDVARAEGLLELAVVSDGIKEIVRPKSGQRWLFDLAADPLELTNLAGTRSDPGAGLSLWMEIVDNGLRQSDDLPPEPLDEETIEQLRALGYTE